MKPVKFETLGQILDDPKCHELIGKKIHSIQEQRERIVPILKAGQKLKRGPINTLYDNNLLYPENLIREFKLIKNKESKLPLRVRELVTLFVSQAISGTIHHYEKIEKVQSVKAESRKKRQPKQTIEAVE